MRRLCSLAATNLSAAAHAASARAMPASMMPATRLPQAHGSLRRLQGSGHAAAAMDTSCRLYCQPDVRWRFARDSRQQPSARFAERSQNRQHCVGQAACNQRQHGQLCPPRHAVHPSKPYQPAPWHLCAHQRSPWQQACSGRAAAAAAAANGLPAEASDTPGQLEAQRQQPHLTPAEDAALAGTLTLDSSIDESVDVAASHSADGSPAAGSDSSSRPEADPSLGLAKRRASLRRSLRYLCFTSACGFHPCSVAVFTFKPKLHLRQLPPSHLPSQECCSGSLEALQVCTAPTGTARLLVVATWQCVA